MVTGQLLRDTGVEIKKRAYSQNNWENNARIKEESNKTKSPRYINIQSKCKGVKRIEGLLLFKS